MIGLYPKTIFWWHNDWWSNPEKYLSYKNKLGSIKFLKTVFNRSWSTKYYRESLAKAEQNISAVDFSLNPFSKACVQKFRESRKRVDKYAYAVMLGAERHPFISDISGEGTYFLDSLIEISESIRALRRHKNYHEIKKRLKSRLEYNSTLAEINFGSLIKSVGVKVRVQGKSWDVNRNYDYSCSYDGHKLAIDVANVESISGRESLGRVIEALFFRFVPNEAFRINNFKLIIYNAEMKDVDSICTIVKKIESNILKGIYPSSGIQEVGDFGHFQYDQNPASAIAGRFVSQVYDNKVEAKRIDNVLKGKRSQFSSSRDSILAIFMPHSFCHFLKIDLPCFEKMKSKTIAGVLAITRSNEPGNGNKNEMSFISNPYFEGRNQILEMILKTSN